MYDISAGARPGAAVLSRATSHTSRRYAASIPQALS